MPANLLITDVEYPRKVNRGEGFRILLEARNAGETGEIWIGIYNIDTGEGIYYDSLELAASGYINADAKTTIVYDTTFKASTGHISGGKLVEDDSRKFTVQVVECDEEGKREVLEYCSDGETVKRERVCENGKWVEYEHRCPAPPPPDEETWLEFIMRRIQEILGRRE